MSKRQSVQRVPSLKVQGKDSWVEFKRFTVGESKKLREEAQEHDGDSEWQQAHGEQMLCEHIINWNWVDDADQALQLPSTDPTVIDQLTDDELNFLMDLFKPKVDQKN